MLCILRELHRDELLDQRDVNVGFVRVQCHRLNLLGRRGTSEERQVAASIASSSSPLFCRQQFKTRVSKEIHPLGIPAWLETVAPDSSNDRAMRPFDRLLVMQDTGGAIRGPIRGDVYWGFGKDPGAIAGSMRSEGRIVTRTMLLENVWGFHFDPQTSVVENHISRLRAKIDKGFETEMLKTMRGVGYSLRA